jgi:uncharacterized protein (DUF779 family)
MHFTVRRRLGMAIAHRPGPRDIRAASSDSGRKAMTPRVIATEKAADLVRRLEQAHGPLLFHQSGGCCDGSSPMCYPRAEFRIGPSDVLLGEAAGCPVYIGAAQFELWAHTQLVIDVVAGRGAGFSVEAPEGVRFLTRSRVFSAEEQRMLAGTQCTPAT